MPIFKLSRAVLMNEAAEAEENVLKLTEDFLPEGYSLLFNGLYQLYKGNMKDSISDISNILGFEHEFLLLDIVAMVRNDKDLTRFALKRTSNALCNAAKRQSMLISQDERQRVNDSLLALFNISKGSDLDIRLIVKEGAANIDLDMAECLYKISKNHKRSFEKVLD